MTAIKRHAGVEEVATDSGGVPERPGSVRKVLIREGLDDRVLNLMLDQSGDEAGQLRLTGEGWMLGGLLKAVPEQALEIEPTPHLGYNQHDPAGNNSGNSCNGSIKKTLQTGAMLKDQRDSRRLRWIGLVLSGAALASAGCGARADVGGVVTPVARSEANPSLAVASPLPSPRPHPTLTDGTLTDDDSEATVTAHVGQQIVVALEPGWDRPRTSTRLLHLLSVSGGYPSPDPLRAIYQALAPGRTRILTHTDLPCYHTRPPCLIPVRVWQVQVIVQR